MADVKKTIGELLKAAEQKQGALVTEVRGLLDKFNDGTWDQTKDGPALEAKQKELQDADHEVRDLRNKANLENRLSFGQPVTVNLVTGLGDKEADARKNYRLLRAVSMASSGKSLDGLEAEMAQEAEKEARAAGVSVTGHFQIPSWLQAPERRDMTVGTAGNGGYTVPTDVGQLIGILEPRLVTESLGATRLSGLVGNIDFPRNNADASAAWEGEVDDANETTPTFDRVQMSPKRLAAFTTFSKQLAAQSSISVENFVRGRLNFAVRKALDTAALKGGGSNEPTGVLGTSGVNTVAIGTNGGALTWALVVKFETEVANDNADMGNLAYLFTPGVAGNLKTTEKASSTGQFIWNGNNQGRGEVNGYMAMTSNLLPKNGTKGSGSNLHAAIYGDWSSLIIGQWAGLDVVVDNITLAGKAQIKIVANSWWDIALRHPESFCICTDIVVS